jgi:iron complex transport system substrate-binding protein
MLSTIGRSLTFGALMLLTFAVPAAAQTRIVTTTFGDVEIPVAPQRIVTVHNIATQPLIELGIIPVGIGSVPESQVVPENWARMAGIPAVDSGGDINFEQVVGLEPDLIFALNITPDDALTKLRQIAPVIQIGIGGADRPQWQKRAAQIADAVGRIPEYEALEAAFAARQAGIGAEYGAIAAANPIAAWATWSAGVINIFPSNSMIGNILVPAGAVFAAASEELITETGAETEISSESVGTYLGDASLVLYGTNLDLTTNDFTATQRELANYRAVPAVAAGHEFPIGKVTIAGFGDANATLDNYVAAMEALAAQP